jgi:hypothetical protein
MATGIMLSSKGCQLPMDGGSILLSGHPILSRGLRMHEGTWVRAAMMVMEKGNVVSRDEAFEQRKSVLEGHMHNAKWN